MSRYNVYRNDEGNGYLLDVQTDLLSGLNTRMVVPLMPREFSPQPAKRLNPSFDIDGTTLVMVTQYMAAVPLKELKESVAHLGDHHQEISDALDMLFQGF